jgi:hypothetical protein
LDNQLKLKNMKESINIWGIKEYEGDGVSCPIIPTNLPWYKKLALTFFRFGVCPACVTMSLTYSIGKFLGISKPLGRRNIHQ